MTHSKSTTPDVSPQADQAEEDAGADVMSKPSAAAGEVSLPASRRVRRRSPILLCVVFAVMWAGAFHVTAGRSAMTQPALSPPTGNVANSIDPLRNRAAGAQAATISSADNQRSCATCIDPPSYITDAEFGSHAVRRWTGSLHQSPAD